MKRIASRDNSLFKMLSKLESSARERRETGKTLLDGMHLVTAATLSRQKPELIILRESSLDDPEIRPLMDDHEIVVMNDALFNSISPVKHPTGVLALISIPECDQGESEPEFCVFLEAIQDPGNMGSILRSVAASGATDAFLSKGCADPWSPKVLRAGMGAHFGIRVHVESDIHELVRNFEGNTIVMTLAGSVSLFDLDLKGRTGFVIGNEGAGISQELCALASIRCRIPMPGRMESLNAASAAAICLFERVRQTA